MKNIILITFDSLRADHCGYCGYERETTPNVDSLAQEGIGFTNAVSPASRTNPSMAGIFTGTPLVTRDQVSNPENSKYHLRRHGTIAESLSEKGYATAAFCPNAYSSRYYGFDQGFDVFEDFLFTSERYQQVFDKHISSSSIYTLLRNMRNLIRKEEAFKSWDTYVDDVVEWANTQNDPFFLWTFSLDTHFPYITPRNHRRWSNAFGTYYYNWKCNQLLDEFDIEISERDAQGITNIYDDSIQFADKLIEELQNRITAENTVFIVCADHGEAIDERGMYGHFYPSLYEENIHVPLVIGGDIERSETIHRPVPLTDLPLICNQIASEGDIDYSGRDIAMLSTYDGRKDRNLISARTKNWKYHLEDTPNAVTRKLYSLEANSIEPDTETTNKPELKKLLGSLVNLRNQHESEIEGIRKNTPNPRDIKLQEYTDEQTLPR